MSFLNDEQLKYLNGIGLQGTKSSKKIRQGTSELENLLRNDPIAADMYSYGAGGALQQGANSETAGNGFLGWLKDSADAGAASVVGGTARTLGEFMPFGQEAFNSAADYMDEVARRNSPTEELTGMNYVASAIGNALGSGGATMAETAALIGAGKLLGLGGLASGALGLASKTPGLGTLINAGKTMWQSPYGKYLVANVAGSPLEAVAESGNLITDMRNENAQAGYSKYSDEEIRNAALRSAGLNTAWLTAANMLEAGALGKITGALAGNVGERTAKQIARQAILGGGSSAISEGGEEYFQNLIGDYSKLGNIKDLNYDEALEAAKMGAIGGGVLGGLGAGGSAFFTKSNKPKGDIAEEVTSEGETQNTEENFWDNKDNARKAIKDAYSNGMLSKDDARNLLIKLDNGEIGPEAEKVQKERAKQTEQLLEKQRLQGYDDELDQYTDSKSVVEETAPSPAPEPVIQGLTQQQGPQLFDNTLSNVFAQADKDKENAAREAFRQAILGTPTGKGVMPEIINPITGDAFSQPFSLGTITKATQNKALGATPSAYTSRKAMATGNAANQAINFPAQAGLNQSNMPIGSAQNLRQQVNAANLALAANRGATDKTAFQQQPAQQPSDVNATADRLMAEQAITNLFDNARLLPPEYYANRDAQQQAQAELAERRKALANILGNVATQKWDETQQEYGNRRQQALQNIANIVNARAAGKWDKLEGTNASKQQSVQGIANIVNALAAGRFDKAEADSKANVDAKERQKAAQAIANIVNARAAGMWDSKEAENQAKAEARQAIANIVNARAAQQWDQAEKGPQNEKTEQKREAAKNTQGAKAEKKQNAKADKNVKQPKEEKPVEQKPKEEESKVENDNKINLPEGVTVEVSYNEDKNGVELKFNKSPGKEVTSKLSASGYRWSKKQQHWWATQDNADAMALAKQFEGREERPIPKLSSDKVTIFTDGSFKGSKIATDKLNEHNDQALIDYLKENGWTRNHDFTDAPFIYSMETNLNKEAFDFVRNWTGKPIEINGFGDTANTYDDYVKYIEDYKAKEKAKEDAVEADRVKAAKDSNAKVELVQEGKRIKITFSKAPSEKVKDLLIKNGFNHPINTNYWHHSKDEQGMKVARMFDPEWVKHYLNPATNKQDLTTEQDKLDFKREEMTEAFSKLLGIDSVMSYDDAVKKFGEDRLNEGQVVLHIPNSKLYFIVEKYNEDDTAKHGMKYHVDAFDGKVNYDTNNVFDAKNEDVVAERVRNPKGENKPLQWQGRTPDDWMLQEVGRTITMRTGDERTIESLSYAGGEWMAELDDGAALSMKSLELYNRNLQDLTQNREKALALQESPQKEAAGKDTTQATRSEADNPNKVESYQEEKKKLEAAIEKDMRKYPNIDFDKKKTGSLYKGKTWREVFKDISHNRDVYINVDYYVTDTLLDEPKFKGYSLVGLDNKGNYRNAIPRGFNDFIKDNFLPIDSKDNLYYKGIVDINSISNEEEQATAATFKDNPESLINTNALNNMSLSQLNYINNMFNDGEDRNKAKKIIRQALLDNNGNSKLQAAARNNNLQDFTMVYNKAVDNFMVDNLEKYPFFEKLLNENTFAEKEMGKAAEEAYKLFRAGMENDNQDVVKSKVEKSTKEVADNGNNEGRYSEISGGQVSEGSSRSQEKRNLEQTGTGQLYVGEQQVQRPKTEHPEERPNTEGRNNDGGLPENPRSGKGSTGTSERGNDVLTPAQKKDAKASEIPGHNYTITEKSLGEGGPKTKYANNVAAIKLLKKLEAENRLATPSEQKILAKYVGWGGLSSVFSINASGNAMDPVWAKEAKEIKELLTPAEYKAARASTNTAFYTPIGVIKNIYKMLDRLGFKHGKILEPSMGTGNFFGVMPNAMREKSALNGVEIDPLTAKIAQQLYQRANIEQTGYEGTKYPDNFFDVVISNVPFGVSLYDPKYAKYNFKSHNYFFAKAMDQVRPGGLVCFVTSTDTMQGSADAKKLRELLRGKADLVAAVRLPNTTFKDNAGTEVTSDIIILQKREQGATPSKNTQAWLETVDSGVRNSWGQPLSINEYYANHPEMLIGELKAGGKWGNLILDGTGVDVEKAMQKLVTKLPKDIYKPRTSTRNTNSIESAKTFLAPSNSREGSLLVHNDGLVYQTNQGKIELLGETAQAKAKDYIQLRDTVKALLQAQVDPQTTDELLDKQRTKLNEAYDNFVKKHGYVNSPRNISSLSIDPDYGIIESIEDYRVDPLDKKKVTAKKRAIFTQRTVNPVIEVTKADNINDALSLSLSNTGNVDLAYMSKLLGGQNEDSIIEELGDRVYNNPTTEGYELAEEYLSGNVREKLEIAEMAAKTNPAYRKNVEALKKVQPKELQQEDVSVGLGTPWIPASDIQQFAADLLNTRRDAVDIKYIPQTGSWVVDWGWVDNNTKKGVENTQTWGTADKSFKELLSHALNQSTPTVSHKDANGNYYIDSKATLAAQAKLKEIQTKFADWIWQDEERTKRLLAYYNRNFNNWVLREYDGSALTFPGYSTAEPALKDHQKNAVWRILQDGTALIAHCVGSGKTWTMQTAAMELKRLGLANKSMFVIPNHMLQQFENEFRRIYPNAKLLTLSNDTLPDVNIPGASKMKPFELKRRRALKNAKRQATLSKVATEDWDGIIISHNLFKRIPMSPTKYNEFYEKQLAELEQALTEAKRESKGKDPATKELEKAKKALETKLKRDIKEEEKDIVIPFEQLGIDQIFVDEADMFKNLYFPTKMTRIAGMSNTNSQRSMDMFIKTQYIQEVNNGRGVVFATGTPISNTMAEMFTMLRYLDMKGLKEKNLGFFDNWASTFATKETATELAPDGSGYRSVEKFTKFNNMPELIKMFRKVADVKKREDLDIKVPNLKNNKPTVVEVPMNSALKTYIEEEASKRANAIHNRQVEPTEDNMLKLTGDLRKASLDIRLVDPTVPASVAGAKVQAVIDHAYDKYEETADKQGVQLIFCDLSTPKGASDKELISDKEDTEEKEEQEDNTNITVYEEIKKGLIKKGIPANQIAFIHDAKTKAAKEQLFERCRRGDIRVLIGSTEKMGAGTNIQNKLVALHHVDAPWRPRDIEQREGRILRQGNENEEVEIFNYVTKGSFDANMWEKIKNKATMIGQAMSGDLTQRTLEDTDATVLSFAEIEALASGNPLMAERVMVNAKLNQYSVLAANYKKDQAKNKRDLETLPKTLKILEEKMQNAKEDIKTRIDTKGDKFSIKIGGITYDSRTEAKEIIERDVKNYLVSNVKLGGFNIKATLYPKGFPFLDNYGKIYTAETDTYRAEVIGKNRYYCDYTVSSMEYTVMNMPEKIYLSAKNSIESTQKRIKAIEAELNKPFKYQEEYEKLQKRSAEIEAELQKMNEGPSVDDVVQQALDLLKEEKTQYSVAQTAYHGTNRTFDKFNMDNLGTGAGEMRYGWGLYFTKSKKAAEFYKGGTIGDGNGAVYEVKIPNDDEMLRQENGFAAHSPKVQKALKDIQSYLSMQDMDTDEIADIVSEEANNIARKVANKINQSGYQDFEVDGDFEEQLGNIANAILNNEDTKDAKAELADSINEQLQYQVEEGWTDNNKSDAKKTSKDIADLAENAVRDIINKNAKIKVDLTTGNGLQIYRKISNALGSDKEASLLLNKNGIKGLKHIGTDTDSVDYVVFSDEAIKIQRQYMAGNVSAETLRPRAEIEAEIRTAFPNSTITYENGIPVVTLPNGAKFQYSIRKNIIVNAREQKKADSVHGTSGGVIQGFWQKFSGNGVQRLLAVAQNSERGTAFHEAMHAAIDLALTEKEANALRKYYQNKAKEQKRNVDEVIADAYRDWVLARQQKRGTAFGKLWQKIKDFCVRIRSLFDNGAEVQRIMQDVESGKVYERGANNGNGMKRQNAQRENIQYSVAAPKSKIASAFTNTERKGTIQSVKDFFKEHWKSFYSDYVDKNDVLHAFDVLTNSGLTLYEQVQNLPSTTAGFLKAISEGTEKHIDAANKHLKNVKMKHRVTLAMALDTINKETMDKAHPDYLAQNGFDSWVNAFGAYLGAERLLEMNSIAKAQGEEYKLPNKLTEAELQQFVRNAPMQFKKAADIFYKVNDNMLSVMEDAGVFSHDLAQLLRTKYKKYCPLLRDFSDTAAADSFINGLTTGGRGIGNVSIPLKKISISGSERGVLNPLETVLKSYAVMLNRAERNKVGLMAVNSAKEAGMEDIIEEVPEIIGKNGEVVNAVADPKNCVFTVLVNGKKKAYKTTPELYGPIVGYNVPAAGLVFGVARTAAKMLRTGATMSPSFILRNVLRDTFFAGISSKNGFIPILDTFRGMNALWNDPAMRAEFEAAGVTEFNFYSSQEQRIKSIDAMAGEKPVGPLEMIKWAFRNLEAASDFMESATRMGEFMKARGKGLSIEEAARAAREVTLDFSRSGRIGEQINQVVPFFNACVQGGDKMRRLLREDFRGTATKLFKYIVLPSIFLWAMNYDEDWYKDLDPDIKNNYWCLGKNIRIPKPQEAGVLFGSGFEALLDQANGKDSEAMANWAKAFMSNMTPGIVPTLFLPLLEWQANYSYFKGRPLVSSKYQRLPDELQYNDYTSELSKSIGNNPLYKVSPMKVDNLVRGYTGTMGALLWSLPDYATDKAKNQPARNWYEYTPFRDFTVTDANMSRPLNDFYGMLDVANRQHAGYGVKGKPTQAVQAIRKTGTMISNIRKDIAKITKSKLTAERKRQLIDQRKAKMNQLARQANERYGKYFD